VRTRRAASLLRQGGGFYNPDRTFSGFLLLVVAGVVGGIGGRSHSVWLCIPAVALAAFAVALITIDTIQHGRLLRDERNRRDTEK